MSIGYKGSVVEEYGYVFAPYNPFEKMTWKTYLYKLQRDSLLHMHMSKNESENGLDVATKLMQEKFPGNYTLTEKYNPKTMMFELDIYFDDPKEKTLWLLKYD